MASQAANKRRGGADEALALALAGGRTITDAAASANVSRSTVNRRMQDPEFQQRVRELRAEMVETAAGRLAGGMADAADVLRELLASKSEMVRLSAARSLLEFGVKIRESSESERRLAEYERQVAELMKPKDKKD
jgi:hypothetical protein